MICERCAAEMREDQVVVSGGSETPKGVAAWHCRACGRREYRALVGHRVPLAAPAPTSAGRGMGLTA